MWSMQTALPSAVKGIALCCPACKHALEAQLHCPACNISYPEANGRPVLLNEANSVFRLEEFAEVTIEDKFAPPAGASLFDRLIPSDTVNVASKQNYVRLAAMLPGEAKVLVIGSGAGGYGSEPIHNSGFCVVNTDVYPSPLHDAIVDAHDIPFAEATFDCVIAQAVLEHVVDPARCVAEMHRVLKPNGVIYAETPFMQQVHMAEFDFMRFSYLGHQRLFRDFSEIASGVGCGPGTALAWAWKYFLKSFVPNRGLSWYVVGAFARLTSFWAPLCDHFLSERPGAYDAASGFYFLGQKSTSPVPDRDLLRQFRGIR
jgi:SAM-dependent methyltransferase